MRAIRPMRRWRHKMRQNLRPCLHQKPLPVKATPLLGDMETFFRLYFFFYFLDVILTHVDPPILVRKGGME